MLNEMGRKRRKTEGGRGRGKSFHAFTSRRPDPIAEADATKALIASIDSILLRPKPNRGPPT